MHISELCSIPNLTLLEGIKVRPGGAEVPLALRHQFLTLFPSSLYVRYATTETGAISMAGPADHIIEGSCGKPLPGVKVEIVDETGAILPPNSVGEIRVQTQGMATEYLDNVEQTARRFRDGWFYPGDSGYLKSEGELVVCGRKDDMIILNGINIFPSEIEHVLELHPEVDFAIALALPSGIHGQIPVAAVQLKPGSKATLDELMIYSRDKLALKCPRRILIIDTLPRNNLGKLLRREARSLFAHNKT
jgi:acyl-CoA synthetase (AMP-forming)/AMP-acid ligase II